MASVAESVARLTHPSSQTGRGRESRPSASFEGGDWAIGHNGHEDASVAAASLPVDLKSAICARRLEAIRIIDHGPAGAEPARVVEVDPQARRRSRTCCAANVHWG